MKLTKEQLEELCAIAKTTAKTAGVYIQSRFDQEYETKGKVGGDSFASQVVTEVDFKAQEIILEGLSQSIEKYDLGLLTEESTDDQSRLTKDYFWCIDPMDGTLPFTERRTGYAVSNALIAKEGYPVIGVVYVPDLEDCYTSIQGAGVYLNDEVLRPISQMDSILHWYMDQSFQKEPYYEKIVQQMYDQYGSEQVMIHYEYGGVRNAIGVMTSGNGCYFKFPKERNGCGSIWDYAATRLFFEELGLQVSNARGEELHLNDPDTTFMNRQGILYATDELLAKYVNGIKIIG
ncbi:MAG TPA: inositol monophosphatase [Cytophagales bacterium]|nr:inositol monophosphatase [Cytophagales bacterium]